MMDNPIDPLTFRNFGNERALPIRRWGAFLPGEGVGGSGIHWGALHWRNLPTDFRIRSALAERYGAKAIPADMMFGEAAKSLGYHPFPAPVAIASNAYVNSEGIPLGACEYCGFCNRMA